MVRVEHELFQVAIAIAKAGHRFVGGLLKKPDKIRFVETGAHAATTAAGRGFDHHRQANALGFRQRGLGIRHDVRAGSDRYAIGHRRRTRGRLVAHHRDHLGRWPDESDAGRFTNFREAGIFGKKPIARMDRLRAGDFGSGDDAIHFKVRLLARSGPDADRLVGELDMHRVDIRLGVNSDRFDIEFAAGADDAKGDFATVGYQDAFEHDGKNGKSVGSGRRLPVT